MPFLIVDLSKEQLRYSFGQCDQTLEHKLAQSFSEVAPKVVKINFPNYPQKSSNNLVTCVRKFFTETFKK